MDILNRLKALIAPVSTGFVLANLLAVLVLTTALSIWGGASGSRLQLFTVSLVAFLLLAVANMYFVRRLLIGYLDDICGTLVDLSENRGRHLFIPDETANRPSAIKFHFRQLLDQNAQLSTEIFEREKIYTSILNTQEELVFIIDTDGYISYRNKSFDEIFGAPSLDFDTESSVFSENLSTLMQEISPIINDSDNRKKQKQLHYDIEVDGKVRHIVWAINQVSDVEPIKTLFVGRDETEELEVRNSNERLQKIATVGRAASTIFHEINQPLSVMHISTFMIKHALESVDVHLTPEVRDELFRNAEMIESQIDRANQIVSNLRLFHSSDKKRLVYELIPVPELIGDAVAAIEKDIDQHGIELDLRLSDDDSPVISGNRTLFTQMLVNLIKNAVQASLLSTDVARPRISIQSEVTDNAVLITIEDNGPGIAETEILKVMEPFYTTKEEGSGLGLALCLDILNSYQGHLELKNIEPHGIKALVNFPYPESRLSKNRFIR